MDKLAEAQNLLKQASQKMRILNDRNRAHEKRAHALRLLYKQAELGYGQVPSSYSELEEKVASLLNQDLDVLEKALELSGGRLNLGELSGSTGPNPHDATEAFAHSIING